jgi:HD-GYP domain-containing protein (c-di-GMP phosphodiesterase class II)
MTSDRPYRSGINLQQALEELTSNAGKQFDPLLVEVFAELFVKGELEILKSENQSA